MFLVVFLFEYIFYFLVLKKDYIKGMDLLVILKNRFQKSFFFFF